MGQAGGLAGGQEGCRGGAGVTVSMPATSLDTHGVTLVVRDPSMPHIVQRI